MPICFTGYTSLFTKTIFFSGFECSYCDPKNIPQFPWEMKVPSAIFAEPNVTLNCINLIGNVFSGNSIGISQSIKIATQGMDISSCLSSPFLKSTVSVFISTPVVCPHNCSVKKQKKKTEVCLCLLNCPTEVLLVHESAYHRQILYFLSLNCLLYPFISTQIFD